MSALLLPSLSRSGMVSLRFLVLVENHGDDAVAFYTAADTSAL